MKDRRNCQKYLKKKRYSTTKLIASFIDSIKVDSNLKIIKRTVFPINAL